jgi:transaldolase/glucose-6-phosphate isomerase
VDPESPTLRVLEEFRQSLRSKKKVATCLGLGPRYLHSTGQAFKGGPNTGVFLLVTEKGGEPPVPIPGERLDFQTVHLAQALGDFRVLAERGRRVLRLHVTKADGEGTGRLKEVLEASLAAA